MLDKTFKDLQFRFGTLEVTGLSSSPRQFLHQFMWHGGDLEVSTCLPHPKGDRGED